MHKAWSTKALILDAIDTVLKRDKKWIEYYTATINTSEISSEAKLRTEEVQSRLVKAGLAESECATAIWQGDLNRARAALLNVIEDVARADSKIAGWFNLWIGLLHEAQGDSEAAAAEYERARSRLGPQAVLPRIQIQDKAKEEEKQESRLIDKMRTYLNIVSADTFNREMRLLDASLAPLEQAGATSQQCEEAVRCVGEMLGFTATRPDNEGLGGADVLWVDELEHLMISLELKTDKKSPAIYNVEDVGKSHSYAQWAIDTYGGYKHLGLIFIGPSGTISSKANPSADMYWAPRERILQFGKTIIAGLRDIRASTPLGRFVACKDFEKAQKLSTPEIFRALSEVRMNQLKQ